MASVVSSVSDGLSGVKCIRWPQWCQVYQMASVGVAAVEKCGEAASNVSMKMEFSG